MTKFAIAFSRTALGIISVLGLATGAQARLGETEAQAQARYGMPTPSVIGADEKPVMVGAKEVIYTFEGWRIRAAYVNNVTVRIEYVHLPPKQLTEEEIKAVLDAEKGGRFAWREEKPRTGYKELNALKTLFDGRIWERSDHAQAKLKANLLLVLETRDADGLEKKLAKSAAKAAVAVPKF
jgi:hypothetical protein